MNTLDILKYGHLTVVSTIEGVPDSEWDTPDVCGWWSVKNIIAHLASFEHMLSDITKYLQESGPTPTLDLFLNTHQDFNDTEVGRRQEMSASEVWNEYEQMTAQTKEQIAQLPMEFQRKNGVLAWYGPDYDLEDFIVYTFYGHKREHMAQINVFKDKLGQASG
jgi:hypothetical protein